jgi:hypothetical protein
MTKKAKKAKKGVKKAKAAVKRAARKTPPKPDFTNRVSDLNMQD